MITVPFSDGTGTVMRHPDFASRYIAPRHVDVWHPPDYLTDVTARYPVLYMHDGQNLFDPATSFIGVDWGMDEAMTRLNRDASLPGAMVVGIWNTPQRHCEYMPQKPLCSAAGHALQAQFAQQYGGTPRSDAYLRFLVEELKPRIDAAYRTLPDREHTFIMGSSMGGLISLYALVEYPHVFGGAACLSTHWPIGEDVVLEYFGGALPKPGRHKLYFDFGTETLDAAYEPYQRRMDALLRAAGYTLGGDWVTRKFEGAEHSERAWRERVHIPLQFLLGAAAEARRDET